MLLYGKITGLWSLYSDEEKGDPGVPICGTFTVNPRRSSRT